MRLRSAAASRGGPVAAAVVATALLLGACGGGDAPASDPDPASTSAPSDDSPNPVVADDFPDPDVLEVDGVYYAYATEGNLRNVRVARSDDLVEWETLPDALPDLPSWVIPGKTWAPEVAEIAAGQYVLYFTATNVEPTFQCIGTATATSPEGPFTVVGEGMLVCPPDEGGAIDAATFADADGTRYLLWKNDGNCCGLDTWIQIAPLAPDGLSLAGPPTRLVQQDQEWEGNLVEAPTLVLRDGVYTLLYSANDYGGASYAIGRATATSVLGPYTKDEEPFLTTSDAPDYVGPGGQDVVVGPDGEDLLVFHSWYLEETYRGMNVLPLEWQDGVPGVVVD
ncbi:glycoside hydrolase family 43 protein [Cellulomonas aerilata]|uniref:Glycosyl hydrolase family 43 n=1 Tax=Cellulomonas aerilata TaxID=515326 RepID=A0A512D7B5_9CELL|nr:glycoside hydrolase family 43 protein [Cellulomonas aerilata]GEO32373.1 hypothetical protein CAE01nite_00980 [Cellulomonas aerilata]